MSNAFDLKFLGTSACEFSDKLNGEFKNCFDKDARRSSAILMCGTYLVDCGIYALESLRIASVPLSDITNVFVTHLHRDHYKWENLVAIAKEARKPLRIWVREGAEIAPIDNAEIIEMTPFVEYTVDSDISVIGMPANHDPLAHPQHFIFKKGGKKIFYGCDGGWFVNLTFKFLTNQKLDLAVLDSTVGDYDGDFRVGEHNSISMIRLLLPSLRTIGAIREDTKIILSHLAPSLHKSHSETEKIAETLGAAVAYDGFETGV